MTKIVYNQAEFNAVVADPQGVASGRAVVVPRLWDKWISFTGARDDGDSLVLYTWLDESKLGEYSTARPYCQAHKASIADAALFLLGGTDKLFEVRIDKNDVTEVWFDKPYASKFTLVREINPAKPFEENN